NQPIVRLTSIRFDYFDPVSWEITASDDHRISLSLAYPAAVDYYHRADDTELREAQLTLTTDQDGVRLHGAPDWANQVTLEFDHLGDHFFGLSSPLQPDNQHSPDLTGAVIDVEVDAEGVTIVENYASAYSAFYLSS